MAQGMQNLTQMFPYPEKPKALKKETKKNVKNNIFVDIVSPKKTDIFEDDDRHSSKHVQEKIKPAGESRRCRQKCIFQVEDFTQFDSQLDNFKYSVGTLNELDQLVVSKKYYISYSKLSDNDKVLTHIFSLYLIFLENIRTI